MFWVGLLIAFIGALLGLKVIRNLIKKFSPTLTEIHFERIRIFVIIIGLLISVFKHHQTVELQKVAEHKVQEIRENLNEANVTILGLRDYSYVAKLNCLGVTGRAGRGLTESTAISRLLKDVWVDKNGKYYPLCTSTSRNKFETTIQEFPKFPFSYYAIAVCLRANGDKIWRTYAEKAVEIFKRTTTISGHNSQHDQAFLELEKYLNEGR